MQFVTNAVFIPVPVMAREMTVSQSDLEYFGRIADARIFLFSPPSCGAIPKVGCAIESDGVRFDIAQVRICRDVSGRIRAYRCMAV